MLVGLTGASRSGKDSTAHILVKNYGFEQVSLATAIRSILLDLNPDIDGDGLQYIFHQKCEKDWDRVKEMHPDSVSWMIRLGQSCRDNIGEDVWLRAALHKYNDGVEHNLVISDCRQPNEVEWVRQRGGILWKISRPGLEQIRGMDNLLDSVEFDSVLINSGSLEDLETAVEGLMCNV